MKHGEMKHGEMKHANSTTEHHGHLSVNVDDWPITPALTLTAHKDSVSGWNLHIVLKDFTFAPQRINTNNIVGEGHAHLYVNGEKITRLYSNWYYLNTLSPGTHTISVTLNTNDHGELTLKGRPIAAAIELVQE